MFRTGFSFADGIVIATVLTVAVLLLLFPLLSWRTGAELLVVTPEGSASYSLRTDRSIVLTSRDVTLTVEISDGRARVTESDCPDKICVSSGWIGKSGQTVVCAPAGVRLTVVAGGGDTDVDFVAG